MALPKFTVRVVHGCLSDPANPSRKGEEGPGKVGVISLSLGLAQNTEKFLGNDPSAGSPTETLLRLLLPLNDQV